MRSTRRQRHKLLLSTLISPIVLLLILQVNKCQVQAIDSIGASYQFAPSAQNLSPNQQYNQQQQSRSSNLLLVNNNQQQPQQIAQSLPLTRQLADSVSADSLDNVIESTTIISSSSSSSSDIVSQQESVLTTNTHTTTTCQLPPTWAGKWYQSNKEPIRVTNTEISDKGLCRDQKGDKYLFEFAGTNTGKQSSSPCLVCLVINERHLNVLQYKESSCQPYPANYFNRSNTISNNNNQVVNSLTELDHSLLESICSDITGDAQLESLFRLETPSIECPINGQFSFTYDSCREPQSSLNSCIDKKQLNFKFNACPDVPGSESKSEVLKCYADWSEGNNYYMIGRLEHASNQQDKGKFRCYVYEKTSDGKIIQMAQSLEESCYGLINAYEGPKTLRLTAKPPTFHKCLFPSYIQDQSENWLSVDSSLIYMFNQNSTKYQVKETKEGNIIEEATCLQQFTHPTQATHTNTNPHHQHIHQARSSSNNQQQVVANRRFTTSTTSNYPSDQSSFQQQAVTSSSRYTTNDVVYLVQITKNCHITNYCVRFYRRSNGIVQIDYFISSPNSDNQCKNAYIGTPQTQIITSTNLEHQRCPFEGAYTIEAPVESDHTYNPSNIFICPRQSFLTAQCDHPSRLRIHSKCSPAKFLNKNLYCLGSWTTNGLVRLLLADDERQRYSAWYRDYGMLQPVQDGASSAAISRLDAPQAQALQQQQPVITTRSQQLLAGSSAGGTNNYLINSLTSIIDLQIALITPLPIVAKPMQVRLTRRNQCSELRGYINQGVWYGGSPSMPSYASSATASSTAASPLFMIISYYSPSSMLIMIVTLLMPLMTRHVF